MCVNRKWKAAHVEIVCFYIHSVFSLLLIVPMTDDNSDEHNVLIHKLFIEHSKGTNKKARKKKSFELIMSSLIGGDDDIDDDERKHIEWNK